MSEQLKPCPFCGGEARLVPSKADGYCQVECIKLCVQTIPRVDKHYATVAWNTRSEQELSKANARIEELEKELNSIELERKNKFFDQETKIDQLKAQVKELQAEKVKWTHTAQYKLSQHLQAENEKLKERCERQIWNLGGISTLLLGVSIDEFNTDYALPALNETNEFVKKYKELQTKLSEAVEIIKELNKDVEHIQMTVPQYKKVKKFLEALNTSQIASKEGDIK